VKGFARREFELMLLRRMADFQPLLVEDAYTALGATHAEYMKAHNRWVSMLRSRKAPQGLDLYQATLGPPDSQRPMKVGDAELTAYSWWLPGLWPDLRWETVVGLGDVVLNGWLVRAGDSPVPTLSQPLELKPWSCVVGDVLIRFPQAQQVDPQVNSQWAVRLNGYQMWFVHGLYQKTLDAPLDVQ
jgi:hypothetical protein